MLSALSKQMTGVEPASPAWEAGVLPMNYICILNNHRKYYNTNPLKMQILFIGNFRSFKNEDPIRQ